MNEPNMIGNAPRHRAAWQSPRLAALGDVCSLTETGSMATNESPLNLCQQSINNVGNTCMG